MNAALDIIEPATGRCGSGQIGQPIRLALSKVVEGSGLVVGQPAAGATASMASIIDALHDHNVGCVAVDGELNLQRTIAGQMDHWTSDGEIQAVETRVERAVENGQSVVIDISGLRQPGPVLDETLRTLATNAREVDRPWIAIVPCLSKFVPADGTSTAAGETLGRLVAGGRGREIGLVGTVGAPSAVDAEILEACEWRLWHRLPDTEDRSVVRRLLGGEHARAVRDLDDPEAILDVGWHESPRRVRIDRLTQHSIDSDHVGLTPDFRSTLRDDIQEILHRLDRLETALGTRPKETDSTESASTPIENAQTPSPEDVEPDSDLAALAGIGDSGSASAPPQTDSRLMGDGGQSYRSIADQITDFEAGVKGVASAATDMADRSAVMVDLESTLSELEPLALSMLREYKSQGPLDPESAARRLAADQDRVTAYRGNRMLRRAGLIEHIGGGRYAYALEERVAAGLPAGATGDVPSIVSELEATFLD
ncbi:MAG: hypothetical protein ABEH64_01815 [Salinirussus sp.]